MPFRFLSLTTAFAFKWSPLPQAQLAFCLMQVKTIKPLCNKNFKIAKYVWCQGVVSTIHISAQADAPGELANVMEDYSREGLNGTTCVV